MYKAQEVEYRRGRFGYSFIDFARGRFEVSFSLRTSVALTQW